MPMTDLLTLVTKLGSRIDDHRDAFKQSEALTRSALIDPLLRALGWDTEDPDAVVPEYNAKAGRVDYALLRDGSPAVMVEAKKLDTPLQGKVVEQGISYCINQGVGCFAVTDGRRWRIYETHREVPLDQKIIVSFDLKEASAAEVCRKALTLWRAGVESRQVAPVLFANVTSNEQSPEGSPSLSSAAPVRPPGVWKPLSELKPAKGAKKPIEVMFPDETRISIKAWKHMMSAVAHWLASNGWLDKDICPIAKAEGSDSYLVSATPVHAKGTAFKAPEQIGSLHVETAGGAKTLTDGATQIIRSVGQETSQFKIRFPE